MYQYGKSSKFNLETCHPDLQLIFNEVIKYQNCSILDGHRPKEAQDKAFAEGKSQVQWPNSSHNSWPSTGVDVVPYPINWKDMGAFYMFVGRVKQIADELFAKGLITHKLECGADWNMDGFTKDQEFHDLPHFQLAK